MKHLTAIILALLIVYTETMFAVPAYTGRVSVATNSGKLVFITIKGDERFKYALSEDGYMLLPEDGTWKYAQIKSDGELFATEFVLTAIGDESDELKAFKEISPKNFHVKAEITDKNPRRIQRIGIHSGEPITGQRRALVVLMQYKDVKLTKTHDDFDALFNEIGFSIDNAKGSVRDFYNYASAGQLDYVSDIYGPYTASNNMRYYGQNSSRGGGDVNAIELCLEAIKNLPKDIDYSMYDNDKDGIVDNIHIIFAGYGEEAGASSDAIWSHEYPYKIAMKNVVGVNFAGYSCTPELRGNSGKRISNIGVICHELGHALGANDYYDTDYAVDGNYDGTGKWDIMASGSWNEDGRLPPNFNPYVRTHDFGWEDQVELSEVGQITLLPHTNNQEDNIVYRINTATKNDYFLLENRQADSFDASLPGSGLIVYHVHPNIDNLSASNSINNTNPQGFYPVCASGSKPASKQYGNINSSECPFPGSRHVSSFSPNANPAAKAWDGSHACVSLTDIRQLKDGSISFVVCQEEDIVDEPIVEEDDELQTVFADSFESGAKGYNSNILRGKTGWSCYPNGNIVSNTEMIPAASDGKKLLMLFAGKSQGLCEAEISKDMVDVISGRKYYLSFDVMASSLPNSLTPIFKFWVKDENRQIYSQTFTGIKDKWEHIEVPFSCESSSIEYGFYGNIYSGGLYVDNVRLQTELTSSIADYSLQSVFSYKVNGNELMLESRTSTTVLVYTIGGQLVTEVSLPVNEQVIVELARGCYFVKTLGGATNKIIM